MIRKCTNEDISDEECRNLIDPFYDNFDEFVVNYTMPEVIKLLRMKYSLEIICEDNLDFKRIEY